MNLKKLASVAFFAVLISSIGLVNIPYMPQAFAHGAIDQEFVGAANIGSQVFLVGVDQQTFIPLTSSITGVDVYLRDSTFQTHVIDITIFESDGTTLVTSTTGFTTPTLSTSETQVHVDLPEAALVPGNTYILEVDTVDTDVFWALDNPGSYIFGEATVNGSLETAQDFNFATYTAGGIESLQGSVNVLQNCGLDVSGTLNYGSLIPGLESTPDRTVTVQNAGSVSSDVLISGSDWLDALLVLQMLVGVTHFTLNGPDLDNYAAKTPLTSSLSSLTQVTSGSSVPTYWQIQLLLQNSNFAGLLTQSVTFTFDCLIDFLLFTNEPTNTTAGAIINSGPGVVVEIRDSNNILLSGFTDPVTITIGNDPSAGSATLGGTTTVSAAGGVATFNDLTIDITGTSYTLIASAGGLVDVESISFDIT